MRIVTVTPGRAHPPIRPELERLTADQRDELRVIVDSITMTLESMRLRGQLRPEVAGNIMALLTVELQRQNPVEELIRRYQKEPRGMDPA